MRTTMSRTMLVSLLASAALIGTLTHQAETAVGAQTRILTSPPRILASVAPGTTTTSELLVVNQSRSSASLLVRAADLEPDPDGETFGILADVGEAPRGAGEWLSIDRPTLALGPGEQARVEVTIRVPAEADAGGHYGAVVVETAAAGNSGDEPVQLRVRLVTHVNVLVPGDVAYGGSISDIRAVRLDQGRIEVRATFRNEGNIQTTPTDARLRVVGPTGRHSVDLDIPETMPGGTRPVRKHVRIPSPAGAFDSRLSLRLEDGTRVRSATARVIAWRTWVPRAAIGVLVVLALLVVLIPLHRRRRELRHFLALELAAMESDEQPTENVASGTAISKPDPSHGSTE